MSLTKYRLFAGALVGIGLFCALLYVSLSNKEGENGVVSESVYQQQRVVRFSYEIANPSAEPVKQALFKTYLPVKKTSNQQFSAINASLDFEQLVDSLGNQIGEFNLGFIPPFGKKVLSITATVDMAGQASPMDLLMEKQNYLQAEPFIEVDNPLIQELAQKLEASAEHDSLRNIYQWAVDNIKYSGYVSQDKGALYALSNKKGDCTEYMYLVVALARAMNIPARGVGGYVYAEDAVAKAPDYHNWAEVYLDGRWQIIDAQKKVFMQEQQNYIAFRIISTVESGLLGTSHRFLSTNARLKVRL